MPDSEKLSFVPVTVNKENWPKGSNLELAVNAEGKIFLCIPDNKLVVGKSAKGNDFVACSGGWQEIPTGPGTSVKVSCMVMPGKGS